jgi:PEP-CTERM motif
MLEMDMGSLAKIFLLTSALTALRAGSITVTDPFNVSGTSDVTGDKLKFDAQSVQVTVDGGTLTIDIRTNYDNPGLYSVRDTGVRLNPGDIFFTVNGTYQYGIPLAYHNGPAGGPWGDRVLAGHVYEIHDSSALMNARQVLHHPMYIDYRPEATVWMFDAGSVHDVTRGTPSVQVLPISGNDGVNGPLYDIRVITSLPAGLFSSPTDNYGLLFATSTAGNDIVSGSLKFSGLTPAAASQVPEPSTSYLMIGAALVGLACLQRRKGA